MGTGMGFKVGMWNVLPVVVLLFSWVSCGFASVSYDSKAIVVNGRRRILISGSIHYPRSTPEVYLAQMYFLPASSFSAICFFCKEEYLAFLDVLCCFLVLGLL